MLRLVIFVLSGLILSACASGYDSGPSSSLASGRATYALSETEAGPINSETPYSIATLQGLFPGYRFDTVRTMTDGTVRSLLAGFDPDGFQAFQVEARPSRRQIESVQVVGAAFAGPRGERIGMTYAEAAGRGMACKAGSGQWTGLAICSRSNSRVSYVFAPEQFSGASGTVPRGDELKGAHLVRMIWDA